MTTPTPTFYMYADLFPPPDVLLECRGLQRLRPFGEPMAQFYSELGVYRTLAQHPRRVLDPGQAELFYVPVLPHMSQDAGRCNGSGHRQRVTAAAAALQASPHWQRHNSTDHFWTCACVMMKSMLGNELWSVLRTAVHAVHSVPRGGASPSDCLVQVPHPPSCVRQRQSAGLSSSLPPSGAVLQPRLCGRGARAAWRATDARALPRPRDERGALEARRRVRRQAAPHHRGGAVVERRGVGHGRAQRLHRRGARGRGRLPSPTAPLARPTGTR